MREGESGTSTGGCMYNLILLWIITLWLCQNSYWTWSFIVSCPIYSTVIFHSYVSLPEGMFNDIKIMLRQKKGFCCLCSRGNMMLGWANKRQHIPSHTMLKPGSAGHNSPGGTPGPAIRSCLGPCRHQICGWSFANFPRARLDSDMVFFWGNVLFAVPKFKIIQRITVIDGYRLLSLIWSRMSVYASCWLYMYWHVHFYIYVWLVVSTPLKNISQLGWFFPI